MKEVVIKVSHVSKNFKLPTEATNSLKTAIINNLKGIKGYKNQQVLNDINFDVNQGDFLGIVGRNGSGKSTLLKIISRIYRPNNGNVSVTGKLVSFIELGVGFNAELTGRENVYLNGSMLGFTDNEIDKLYDEIVDFAELREFMDQKLKNYSSGMQVRLAFSIAIKSKGDILILDEVLAVGDEAFQRKCFSYFASLKKQKKTVILVTHNMDSVQRFCNRAILIEGGKIVNSGSTVKVARAYRDLFIPDNEKSQASVNAIQTQHNFDIDGKYTIKSEQIEFNISFISKINVKEVTITMLIINENGEFVYRFTTDEKLKEKIGFNVDQKRDLNLVIDNIFCNGKFTVQVGVKNIDRSINYAIFDDIFSFEIVNEGAFNNDIFWKPKESFQLS